VCGAINEKQRRVKFKNSNLETMKGRSGEDGCINANK